MTILRLWDGHRGQRRSEKDAITYIATVKRLLYLISVMNQALKSRPSPKTLSEAKALLATFEVITSEALAEAEAEMPAVLAAA
jgi:hypothetical protein